MATTTVERRLPVLPLTVAASHFSLEFLSNILPIVYPLLIANRGFTYSQIGTIALIGGLCGSITQLLFGALSDRWDARKQVVLSVVWMGVGMGLVGFVSSYAWLIVAVAFAKLASAAYHPAGAALANAASGKKKGTSVSWFSVGGSIGSALCPLVLGVALAAWSLRGTLILIPMGLILGALLWFPLNQIALPVATRKRHEKGRAGPLAALLPIVFLVGTRSWTHGTLATFLPEWYASQGSSLAVAGSAFSLLLVMGSIGNLVGGAMSDRIGPVRVVLFSMTSMSFFFWSFMHLDGFLQLIALGLIGFVAGLGTPSTLVMAQGAWPQAIGLASALVMGVGWTPSSLGSWTIGILADRSSLTEALMTLTFVPLLGAGVFLVARLIWGDGHSSVA